MATRVGISSSVSEWTVLHSKRRTRSRREIDIFIDMKLASGTRSALLIENKLDASEQPDQAESYREELGRIAGDYSIAAMVIVCPAEYERSYREFTSKFDAIITYEILAEYFQAVARKSDGNLKRRMIFRRDILHQAIHKHRRGYTAIPMR